MKIIDISQELFSSRLFPGDKPPEYKRVSEIAKGGACNLTTLSMCAHNGTHADAPYHFIGNGKKIDELDLAVFCGQCAVVALSGVITAEKIMPALEKAKERLLIKGDIILTEEAARLIADKLILLGVEAQSAGPVEAPKAVHEILLGGDTIILEGLDLSEAGEGDYFLSAAPLKLGGSDGAPCRAVLFDGI